MRRITIIFALFLGFWGPAPAQATEDAYAKKLRRMYRGTVPLLQPEALAKQLESGEPVVLLDTRSPEEYAVSHLSGARFVDFDRFRPEDVRDIPPEARIVVYCSVGYRSERIGEWLKEMGFTEVRNLYGGIFEWVNRGHTVVDAKGNETKKVHAYNEKWGRWLLKGEKVYE